jgi:hypothetical protein
MATAPAVPIKPRREMQERTAPEMFQFNDDDRQMQGVLVHIGTVQVKEKEATQYTLENPETGKRVTFLATYDLERKIRQADLGHFVTVIYDGEDTSIKTQGSPMKKFRVQVSKEKEAGF